MKNKLSPRYRHLFIILPAVALLLALAVTAVAAALLGSDFEGDDGNLVVDGSGTDWASWEPTDLAIAIDADSGSSDDSFRKAKEDDLDPNISFGSIPNNKSDLTRFYVAHERGDVGGSANDFLYLAWERANTLGSANIDFEFNQSTVLSGNGVTPQRMADDMLITYTFGGNNGAVDIGLSQWVEDAGGSCEAATSPPCWGPVIPLDPSEAIAGINLVPVSEPFLGTNVILPEQTFGEVALNLTAAGVFSDPTVCVNFGSAHVKSRSSGSFTSSLKDFIAPIKVDVSNCGTITITTQTDPAGAAGTSGYTVTDGGGDSLTSGSTDGGTTTYTEFPGTYIITGDVLIDAEYDGDGGLLEPGYDLTDITCETSDGNSADPELDINGDYTGTVTITLEEDGTVLCTFTYTQRGSIIVVKQTVGGDGDFTFTGDAVGTISDGGSITVENLMAKTAYTVTEGDPTPDFDLTSIICDDANSGGHVGTRTATFNLEPGEIVTCTFTNTKRGTIIVEKQTLGGDDSFTFTGDASGTISDGGTITVDNLVPGIYTSTENDPAPAFFDVTSIVCDDGNSSGDVGTRTATFNLDPGETVKCTFTNTKRAWIIVEKQTVGGDGSFPFTGDASGTISDGGQIVVANLTPGIYSSTESDPTPDFDLTSIVCDDGNSTGNVGTRTATFNVDPGETVTCVFTNTKRGTITVIKDSLPDDPQDFKFTGFSSFSLDDDADGTLPNTETFAYLAPGVYAVTEQSLKGKNSGSWELTGIDCNDANSSGDLGSGTATINLEPGEHIICTFENTKRGQIIVEKQTIPDGAAGSFDFSGDAAGAISDNGQIVVGLLMPGSYTSTEADPTPQDFDLTDISCDDANSSGDVAARTATFNVEPGETVKCTFTNTKRGYILVDKVVLNALAGATYDPTTQTFDFSLGGGEAEFAVSLFQVADVDPPYRLGPLPAGRSLTWAVSESLPDGWDLVDSGCDNGSPVNSIVVPAGGEVTCTFYNEMRLHIGSKGFWRNWDNHYTEREIELLLSYTGLTSDVTGSASATEILNEIYDFSGGITLEQEVLAELVALELDLAATALSESSIEYAYLLMHDPVYPSCIVDPYDVTGESYFYRGSLSISDLTVGEVVNRVEGSWSGSDPMVLDSSDWSFDLTTGWSFDQAAWAAGLTEAEAYEQELILIREVLQGINEFGLLIPDPDTYPDRPSCVQSDSYSLEGMDGLASLYDGAFDPTAFPSLPASLAEGTVDAPYSATLQAGGGTPPYSWSVVDGERFPGMILNPDTGEISGTPESAGTYIFTVQVMDSMGATDSREYSITINPAPVIATTSPLPNGTVDVDYGTVVLELEPGTGTPGYTWEIISGDLPEGLTLDPSNGEISGVPTKKTRPSGVTFTVRVTDGNGATATEEFTILINR